MRLVYLALTGALFSQALLAADSVDFLKPATTVTLQHGQQKQACTDAREAVAKAVAGDVIILGEGTHQGPLVLSVSGVALKGVPGARVNGNSGDWHPLWQKEPAYGPYAYSSPIPFKPVTMTIDQRVMIDAEEDRGGLSVHQRGVGRNGRTPLGAVFTWLKKSSRVVVSFAGDLDPAKHLIEAAPAGTSAIAIRGADRCTVSGLVVTGGRSGVLLQDTKNSTVEKCLIYGVDAGVTFAEGARACRLLSCDITMNADGSNANCDPATGDIGNDVWNAHKKYGTYDKFGVLVDCTGEGNEIAFNYLYDVWDGITADDGISKDEIEAHYKEKVLKGISDYNTGLKVHHNRIDLAQDDALEPGGEMVGNQWYANVVTRARCAARLKTIEMGPYFFYGNVLADSFDGLRLYKSAPASANVYILNNVVLHKTGVIYHAMDTVAWNDPWLTANLPKGTPSFRIADNVFVCDNAFANHATDNPVEPNYKADYNVYTCGPDALLAKRGLDEHSTFGAKVSFVDAANGDYHLAAAANAKAPRDLALDVPLPPLLADAPAGAGLPANDAQSAPHGPVSGLWEMARPQLGLGELDVRIYRITPLRWVSGGKIEFVLRDLPARDELPMTFVRSGVASASFKLTARDASGKVIATRGGTKADKDGFTWNIAGKGVPEIRVAIEDEDAAQWRIEAAEQCKVGVVAGTALAMQKFDGGRFGLLYPVSAETKSFAVSARSKYPNCSVEVRRPDGQVARVENGQVQTDGQAGNYRILVSFTKGASLKLDDPKAVLLLDPLQETVPFRPMWDKPGF
jgi:hypothetical protein